MKTNKNTILIPKLFVDNHHGIYMGQIAFNQLSDYFKNQAIKQMSADDVKSILAGNEDEFYCEACDNLTNVVFKTKTGQKLILQYCEGGIYIIPFCFLRSKQSKEFFYN